MTEGFNDDQQYDADFIIYMVDKRFFIRVFLDHRPYSDVGPFDNYAEANEALADLYKMLAMDDEPSPTETRH